MALNDVYKVSVFGSIDAQVTINNLHYRVQAEGVDEDHAEELAEAFEGGIMPTWKAAVSSAWTEFAVRAQRIHPVLSAFKDNLADVPTSGSIVGDALPTQNAVVLTKRTPTPRARGRGRIYVGGIAEASTTGSLLTPAAITLFESVADMLETTISVGANTYRPIIFSQSVDPPALPPALRDITDVQVQPVIATQRRRRRGVGI